MSGEKENIDPIKARSDLVDILLMNPENTDAIVKLIQSELADIKDGDTVAQISTAIDQAASGSKISSDSKDNVLFWLTETSLDARQMIMVRTIEDLLNNDASRPTTMDALTQVFTKENVDMVMQWVNRKVLTLNQGIYVLLFPESSTTV
ncbi:MAG: hypothetical protein ACTSV2_18815 [Candidatus Thorarchaeota archaeon]